MANVAGPPSPLYLAGARVTEAFPVVPLSGNVTVGIGVLSYAGQLNISVIADLATCPDLPVFTTGLNRSLTDLTGAAAGDCADRPDAARGQSALKARHLG